MRERVLCKHCNGPIDRVRQVGRSLELHPTCQQRRARNKSWVNKVNKTLLRILNGDKWAFSPGNGYVSIDRESNPSKPVIVSILTPRQFVTDVLRIPVPEDLEAEWGEETEGLIRYVDTKYAPKCPRCDEYLEDIWFEDKLSVQTLQPYLNRCPRCHWLYPKFKYFSEKTTLDKRNVATLDAVTGAIRALEGVVEAVTKPEEEGHIPRLERESTTYGGGIRHYKQDFSGQIDPSEVLDDVGSGLRQELDWDSIQQRLKAEIHAIAPERPSALCKCGVADWMLDLQSKPPYRYRWICTNCGEEIRRAQIWRVRRLYGRN